MTGKQPQELWIVTHRQWMADEMQAAGRAHDVSVHHSYGLGLPTLDPSVAWWASIEWMARARMSRARDHLQSPGVHLLPSLRDDVWCVPLAMVPRTSDRPLFIKLAEMKHEKLPAQVYGDPADFYRRAKELGACDDTRIHLTADIMDFTVEVRCFMVGNRPVAASTYLVDGYTEGWDDDIWTDDAMRYAADAAETLPATPSGWVLDVGIEHGDGGWHVIEANPAWSASWYNADPGEAMVSIMAASQPGFFRWTPDPWLAQRTARMRPLPLDQPR